MFESKSLLEVFTGIYKRARAQSDTSYSDVTESARVTPLCIISNDLRNYEHTTMIMQTALNVVTSYYMQALPMVANVGGVNVKKILGRLSTNGRGRVRKSWLRGLESDIPAEFGLPTHNMAIHYSHAMESSKKQLESDVKTANKEYKKAVKAEKTADTNRKAVMSGGSPIAKAAARKAHKKTVKKLGVATANKKSASKLLDKFKKKKDDTKDDKKVNDGEIATKVKKYRNASSRVADDMELSSLAVGKVIDVELKTEVGDVKVPVTLQLQSSFVTPAIAAAMMSSHNVDATFRERRFKRKAGRISGSDFVLASDLIRKRKQLMIQDDNGLLEEIQNRRRGGQWNAAVSGKSHVGVDNNLIITTADVIRTVERAHRGKITNQRIRDRIFNDMGIMIMIIVDKEDEFVKFYYRGMRLPTDVPIKSLKRVSSKGGPDIGDILKSMMSNSSPTF